MKYSGANFLLQLVVLWRWTEFCSPYNQIHKVCGKRMLQCSPRVTWMDACTVGVQDLELEIPETLVLPFKDGWPGGLHCISQPQGLHL